MNFGASLRGRVAGRWWLAVWCAVLLVVVLVAVFASTITSANPEVGHLSEALRSPSRAHWLGTDALGRDELARLLYGARVALLAGFEAVLIGLVIGVPLGLLSGYRGGTFDYLAMRAVEVMTSIPFLVLAIALISVVGVGVVQAMVAVGVIFSAITLRLTRGEVLAAKEQVYIRSAVVVGAKQQRILVRHILPNVAPALIVQATLMFATAVIAEAALSFLGLGIQPPKPSWGGMLADAQKTLRSGPYLALPPGFMIIITALALNQIGDALRDMFSRKSTVLSDLAPVTRSTATVPDVTSDQPPTALSTRGLSVSFPNDAGQMTDVVRGVDLDVHPSEIVCIVGESGSGKSLTALSLLGLVPRPGVVAAESIRVGERELTGARFRELSAVRGHEVAYIFQEPLAALNPAFTVGDQIEEVMNLRHGLSGDAARQRMIALLEEVGIPRPADRLAAYPHQLSGGLAQRVMIAMALAAEPSVLIADEPTTALDVTIQAQLLDVLRSLRDERGMAILLITHDLGVVADLADRVAVMYAGEIVEIGDVREVLRRPRHPYTEALLRAVPRNEARAGMLPTIPGRVAAPQSWSRACEFASRCGYATEICNMQPVPLVLSNGHGVRCVHTEKVVRNHLHLIEAVDEQSA